MQRTAAWCPPTWQALSGVLVAGFVLKIAISTLLLVPSDWLKWPGPRASEAAVPAAAEPTPLAPLPRLMALVDKERQALMARETAVKLQEEQLAVLKKELEERLKEIQALQARVLESLEEEKRVQGEHNRHLVATLQAMPPDRAGKLLEKMEESEAVMLLRRLPGKEAGAILSLLPPDKAARLSQRLMK